MEEIIEEKEPINFEDIRPEELEYLFINFCKPQIDANYRRNKRNYASLSLDLEDLYQEIKIALMLILKTKENLEGDELIKYIIGSVRYRLNIILFNHMNEQAGPICDRCNGKGFLVVSSVSEDRGHASHVLNCLNCGGNNVPGREKEGRGFISTLVTENVSLENDNCIDQMSGNISFDSFINEKLFDEIKPILTSQEYRIIFRTFYGKLSFREIATADDMDGLSWQGVRIIYTRAMKKIKRFLKK